MSAGAVELIRDICAQHPELSVQAGTQPNPDTGGLYTTVAVLNLPVDQFPSFELGDYNAETRLSVSVPDDDGTSVLAVTRYHDDDLDAALRTALDYITSWRWPGKEAVQ